MDCLVSLSNSSRRRQDEDVISQLPDSFLVYILSFLPTKDAIRTSILSRRWKFLWTFLSSFNLAECEFIANQIRSRSLSNQVDGILQKVEHIKSFHFEAYGNSFDAQQVNSWISALLIHKVEELYLSLHLESSFVLANLLAPESLNTLHLEFPYGFEIPSFINFSGLKTLTLSYATFSDETSTQQLFSSCPVLRKLTLCNCNWNINNVSIKIPTLTTLLIVKDDFVQDDSLIICKVSIDAVNLVSLSCTDHMRLEFIPINLTSLVEADIDVSYCKDATQAINLLSGISHVKSLNISSGTLWILSNAENLLSHLPTFHNLTCICVSCVMYEFALKPLMDILDKSPNLEALDVTPVFYEDFNYANDWTLNRVPHCFKHSLKSFSISLFDGSEAYMQLLSFLLKNANLLERIEIFYLWPLSADLKKQDEVSNQLQKMRSGSVSCAFEFRILG